MMEDKSNMVSQIKRWERSKLYSLSRSISVFLVVVSLGSLFWQPVGWFQMTLDILFRTHLMFLCTVMAHESSHGLLGRKKASNMWWGRFVLIPATVPYVNFRKTHRLHHANTNDPENDPDYFAKPNHLWEIPLRVLSVPHNWILWLAKRNKLTRRDIAELLINYVVLIGIYGSIGYFVGGERLAWGMIPSLILVSHMLWYPFAVKTHEGFSTGAQETRSHNYYGSFMYWFTLGLSVHREHHMYQQLSWIELKQFVQPYPGPWWKRLSFPRHIIVEPATSEFNL
jgi:fatty acid desaturase